MTVNSASRELGASRHVSFRRASCAQVVCGVGFGRRPWGANRLFVLRYSARARRARRGAGEFGGLELLAEWRVPFLSVSALAIVGGWGAWWRKRPDACVAGSSCMLPKRSRATLALLLCASAVVLAAASWGYIDPILIKFARGSADVFRYSRRTLDASAHVG